MMLQGDSEYSVLINRKTIRGDGYLEGREAVQHMYGIRSLDPSSYVV